MLFDWAITRYRKKDVTTLEVFHPNGKLAATGTGKDIWEARANALAQTGDIEIQKYITKHLFPDID